MSSNSQINSNESKNIICYVKLENIVKKLEKIGDNFASLLYKNKDEDKDIIFMEIGYDIKSISYDLNFIKNKFKD